MYKKNNGSTEQEILQNQFSAYVKKAVHNRRIQFLTEKSRKFRFETPLFDLDYLLFDTTDIIQEITDHETVRQALRSIKENERRIVLERIIEEKSFGQLSDELGMSYKTVASLYYRAIKKLRRFMEEGESNEFQRVTVASKIRRQNSHNRITDAISALATERINYRRNS